MLRIRGLQPKGLAPVDLTVAPGQCVAVQGASGSGKTLLLRAIADLDPAAGEVSLNEVPRTAWSGPAWRRRVIYIASESGWWAERVGAHFASPEWLRRQASALRLDPGCGDWPVARLSTGERQRLALLRALELAPPVLLLDEPTGALDPDGQAAVEALLDEQRRHGTAMVWVSHDAGQRARVADDVVSLDGRAR